MLLIQNFIYKAEYFSLLKTCQKLVKIQPCVSYALFLLGSSQFALYENAPDDKDATQMLKDARTSYEASLGLEGKTSDGDPPNTITGTNFSLILPIFHHPYKMLKLSSNHSQSNCDLAKGMYEYKLLLLNE